MRAGDRPRGPGAAALILPAMPIPTAESSDHQPVELPAPTRKALLQYSTGTATTNLIFGMINSLQFPVFNMVLGLNPGWLGMVGALARVWDAFTDPVMGYISDRTRSRWGRRRPYIALGAVLLAVVSTMFYWVSPEWSKTVIFLWFLSCSLLAYTASTIFLVPYVALGIEMATDYHQRTRVVAYRSFLDKVIGIANQWMFRFIELFSNSLFGAKVLGGIIAVLGLCGAAVTLSSAKERPHMISAKQRKESIWTAATNVLSNKIYLRLLLIWVVLTLNQGLFQALGLYLNVYYVYGGDKAAGATLSGAVGTLGFVLSMGAIPLTTWICSRLGKHVALKIAIWLYIVGSLLKWVCVNPDYPWLQLVLPFFFGIGISSIYLVMSTMQADIVDYDELIHGGRREGMFSAVGGWVMKLGAGLAMAISGWIIVFTGFNVDWGGAQPPEVFFRMRVLFSIAPIAGCILALFCLRDYPLTASRLQEIHLELQERKRREEPA